MSYKRNAGSNRDALFGPSAGGGGAGGPSYKANAAANRDALFGGAAGDGGGSGASSASSSGGRGGAGAGARPSKAAARPGSGSGTGRPAASTRTGGGGGQASSRPTSTASSARTASSTNSRPTGSSSRPSRTSAGLLSGAARAAKMKEAEDYRAKAKKAMTRGVFSSPDPIAASNYYKRAADAYKACGENRLERLHRIANADCQMTLDAYATAATEYMRAAELAEESTDESPDKRSKEVNKIYNDAAEAWRQQNEFGRAGECTMKAAFGLLIGKEEEGDGDGKTMNMDRNALKSIEEAIEAHVPDLLNRYASFRQLGTSDYFDPNADPNDQAARRDAMEMAKNNMIKKSYAHETVNKACFKLVRYGEYPSALYAAGAATTLIGADGFATISLSRAFVTETILSLSLGDVVGADRNFLETHLQKDSYLKSRECKLAEDLIRAVKDMDGDALEEARSASGSNSAALANLGDSSLRGLVKNLRVSGRAARGPAPSSTSGAARTTASRPQQQKKAPPRPTASATGAATAPVTATAGTAATAPAPPKRNMLEGADLQTSLDANFAELDGLMDDMGLGDDSDGGEVEDGNDYGGMGVAAPAVTGAVAATAVEEEDDDDDFDVDLR